MEVKCKLFSGREAAAPGHRALWRNWIAPSRSVSVAGPRGVDRSVLAEEPKKMC